MTANNIQLDQIQAAKEIVVCLPINNTATKSGLMINQGKDKPELGEVVKVGEGELPVGIEVGDTVVYRKYAENLVYIGSVEYNFVTFKDILAVIKKHE